MNSSERNGAERLGWRSCFPDRCRVAQVIWLLLLAAAAGWLVYLVAAPKPWSGEVEALREGTSSKRAEFFMRSGLWWASAVNLVAAGGLLLLGRVWWGRSPGTGRTLEGCRKIYAPVERRFLVAGLLLAVVAGAWLRAPRLDHGFWNDEEYAFRRYVHGYHRDDGTGVLEFKRVRPMDALYRNEEGNNHVWHTLEARIGLGAWRFFSGAGEEEFREAAVRFVPFVTGLGSIFLVGLLGAMTGRSLAGVVGAWFLALSPWHLRYAVEARGYASMIFFVLLGLIFLVRSLETGRWRWWLCYGAVQCLFLWCFTGAIYVAVVQNALALGFLLKNRRWQGDRIAITGRWFAANAISAMLYLQWMTPSLMQLAAFVTEYQQEAGKASLGLGFLRDVWSHLALGVPWQDATTGPHAGTTMTAEAASRPLAAFILNAVVPVVALSGLFLMLVRGDWRSRLVVLVFGGAAFFLWLHNAMAETKIMGWYFVFLTAGFSLMLGWGAALPWMKRFWWRGGTALVIVLAYAWATHDARTGLRQHERQPMRAAVKLARGVSPAITADDGGIITGSIGSGNRQMQTYDPWIVPVKTAEELIETMESAREAGKKLIVYCCSPARVQGEAPEAMALLEDGEKFELIGEVPGLEEFWSYHLYELLPKP